MKKVKDIADFFDEYLNDEEIISSNLLSKISNKIIKYRLDNHMKQEEFAKFLGISQSMVSKIESEQYNFSIEMLVKIFYKLNLEFDVIFNGLNEVTESPTLRKIEDVFGVLCEYTSSFSNINKVERFNTGYSSVNMYKNSRYSENCRIN